MALLRCDFFSDALGLSTSMTVILPQRTSTQIGLAGRAAEGPPPVLYLLHGLSDDATTWTRRTSLERYVAPLGLAVVMPQVHRSFYADEVYGGRYWTFLSQELPELVQSFFQVSARREDTFVAGLSMGGYGALTWALRQPERFAAAASLSGASDLEAIRHLKPRPEDPRMFERVFGDRPLVGTPDDAGWLVQQADAGTLPALRISCGTEDELYGANLALVETCRAAGVPVETSFTPGEHDWEFWDADIQQVLAWLPL